MPRPVITSQRLATGQRLVGLSTEQPTLSAREADVLLDLPAVFVDAILPARL